MAQTEGLSPTSSTLSSASVSISSFSSDSVKRAHLEREEHLNNVVLNNSYEYLSALSFESDSTRSGKSNDGVDEVHNETNIESLRNLSDKIRVEIEKLVAKSMGNSRESTVFDENFINSLFTIFYSANFKVENFREIHLELMQSNVIRSQQFLVLAKIGHECFKLGLLSTAECVLELAVHRADTGAQQRLKMATLSTLSACYWRQSKYINAIDCMHDELELATQLAHLCGPDTSAKSSYAYNKYRIYGNLASANQRLRNFEQCIVNLKSQLNLAICELNEPELAVNALNSIGILHQRLGDPEKCRDCLTKSLELINRSAGDLRELELHQLNILADFCLKRAEYEQAREYFVRQLWLSTDLKSYLNESIALLSLGFISAKLKTTENSTTYFERCLLSLNTNFDLDNIEDVNLMQTLVELYAKCFTGLVNSYLSQKDTLNASLYAHSMLDFTLKQMQCHHAEVSQKLDRYLKCMEINACSKLAQCYTRQSRVQDAVKLHEREAMLAQQVNSILYLTRAYSHLAHIFHAARSFDEAIRYYKLILAKIEVSLVQSSAQIRDERLIDMIFFTLANIGYCLEGAGKSHEAQLMFEEQFEMSKLMSPVNHKDLKSRAAALLNLVNLSLNKQSTVEHSQRLVYLKNLLVSYEQLGDLNGQLFATQCLAYSCHKYGDLSVAVQFYMKNIEIATKLGKNETLARSLFNASLAYRDLGETRTSLKLQSDYYSHIQQQPDNSLCKCISLGLIAELSFETDSSLENCQRCLEIHLDRLNLIKSLDDNKEVENNKSKLIFDCLESISKLYTQMQDNDQVIKFKQLQLELLDSGEKTLYDEKTLRQKKCKLWLELGGLYLASNEKNQEDASRYFEMVLDEAVRGRDLLLESLAVGNLGLCRQKEGNYAQAIEFFKRQKLVLQEKLTELDSPTVSPEQKQRELIPIRIDMARTDAKLGKCYRSIGNASRAETHLRDYAAECERLHDELHIERLHDKYLHIGELRSQVYVDYDTSLSELGKFYSDSEKFDSAIDLNETRLKLVDENFLDTSKSRDIKLQALFNLAQLFAKKQKLQKSLNWEKSVEFCERLLAYDLNESNHKELLIETLVLRFDLIYDTNPSLAEQSSTRAYQMSRALKKFNLKSLRLKHAVLSRLVYVYRSQSRLKDCLEILMDTLTELTAEFHEFETSASIENYSLRAQYVEYLFLAHRGVALVHLKAQTPDTRTHLLSLKHANEALVYLNQQKHADPKLAAFRLASLFYLLGLCHRSLGNDEMQLEMFASSLDYYENLVQSGIDFDRETLIRDKLIEENESFSTVNYEEDEETVVKYSDRINKLYQLILDVLIRMNKLKEALLVAERHRSKRCFSSLGKLPDLLNFEQVESLINDDRFDSVVYFHFNEISSTLNCWLLKPKKGIVKFERLNDAVCFEVDTKSSNEKIKQSLDTLYDMFFKPIKNELDGGVIIWIVYDERMFKLPFHLIRYRNKCLYERFEVNCVYSLKYLCKAPYNNQIYTRKRITESGATFLPMKVVSSEQEMNKLLERFAARTQFSRHSEQFDLLLLLVNPEHRGIPE